MAKQLLDVNDVYVAASNVTIFGNTGSETVKVHNGVSVTVDGNVERIEFSRASSHYTYQTSPTGMQVSYNNSVVANVTGGQKLSFTDGSASVVFGEFNSATLSVPITLGGAIISSTASSITPTLNMAAGEISTLTPISTAAAVGNHAPTGNVTISGTQTQGQTLTASNSLVDADGLGVISYQWWRDGNVISGATQANYILTATDVGKAIGVKASYIDLLGTAESMTSGVTTLVAASQFSNGGFNPNNDIYILQASDSTNIGKGAGDDKYILSNGGGIKAGQSINVIDTEGTNTVQLIEGLTIASSKATSNAVQLTLSNGGMVSILGASTYHFEVGGNPLTGVAGTIQDFSTFLTSSLGFSTLPISATSLVTGVNNVSINSNGTTSVGSGLNSIVLLVGQTTTGLTTTVAATNAADVFKLATAAISGTTTVTGGFNYLADKIIVPTGSTLPFAIAGGVNNVTDGNVDLTWANNGNVVTISLTGLNATSEAAIQLNAVSATVFGTY